MADHSIVSLNQSALDPHKLPYTWQEGNRTTVEQFYGSVTQSRVDSAVAIPFNVADQDLHLCHQVYSPLVFTPNTEKPTRQHPVAALGLWLCESRLSGKVQKKTAVYVGDNFRNVVDRHHSCFMVDAKDDARMLVAGQADMHSGVASEKYCTRGFQNCAVSAEVVCANHSTYDISTADFARGMLAKGCNIAYIAMFVPAEVTYGIEAWNAAYQYGVRTEGSKTTMYFDDMNHTYTHDTLTWRDWCTRNAVTIKTAHGNACYVIERYATVGPSTLITFTRVHHKGQLSSHNPIGCSDYVGYVDYTDVFPQLSDATKSYINPHKRVRQIFKNAKKVWIPKNVADKTLTYAMTREDNNFQRHHLQAYLRSSMQTIVLGSQSIQDGLRLSAADFNIISVGMFIEAAVLRTAATSTIGKALTVFKSSEESFTNRILATCNSVFGSYQKNWYMKSRGARRLAAVTVGLSFEENWNHDTVRPLSERSSMQVPASRDFAGPVARDGNCIGHSVRTLMEGGSPSGSLPLNFSTIRHLKNLSDRPDVLEKLVVKGNHCQPLLHTDNYCAHGRGFEKLTYTHSEGNDNSAAYLVGGELGYDRFLASHEYRHTANHTKTGIKYLAVEKHLKIAKREKIGVLATYPGYDIPTIAARRRVMCNIRLKHTDDVHYMELMSLSDTQVYNVNITCVDCVETLPLDHVHYADVGSEATDEELVATVDLALASFAANKIRFVLKVQRFFQIMTTCVRGSYEMWRSMSRYYVFQINENNANEVHVTNIRRRDVHLPYIVRHTQRHFAVKKHDGYGEAPRPVQCSTYFFHKGESGGSSTSEDIGDLAEIIAESHAPSAPPATEEDSEEKSSSSESTQEPESDTSIGSAPASEVTTTSALPSTAGGIADFDADQEVVEEQDTDPEPLNNYEPESSINMSQGTGDAYEYMGNGFSEEESADPESSNSTDTGVDAEQDFSCIEGDSAISDEAPQDRAHYIDRVLTRRVVRNELGERCAAEQAALLAAEVKYEQEQIDNNREPLPPYVVNYAETAVETELSYASDATLPPLRPSYQRGVVKSVTARPAEPASKLLYALPPLLYADKPKAAPMEKVEVAVKTAVTEEVAEEEDEESVESLDVAPEVSVVTDHTDHCAVITPAPFDWQGMIEHVGKLPIAWDCGRDTGVEVPDFYGNEIVCDNHRINFYSHNKQYGEFSNFADTHRFTHDGVDYWHTEGVYQYHAKTVVTLVAATEKSAYHCKKQAANERMCCHKHALQIMASALEAKFRVPQYMLALMATGTAELVEDTPADQFWGRVRGTGNNMLGKLLMQLRTYNQQHITTRTKTSDLTNDPEERIMQAVCMTRVLKPAGLAIALTHEGKNAYECTPSHLRKNCTMMGNIANNWCFRLPGACGPDPDASRRLRCAENMRDLPAGPLTVPDLIGAGLGRGERRLWHLVVQGMAVARKIELTWAVAPGAGVLPNVTNVKGDGNCLPRAIAKSLYNDEERYQEIVGDYINPDASGWFDFGFAQHYHDRTGVRVTIMLHNRPAQATAGPAHAGVVVSFRNSHYWSVKPATRSTTIRPTAAMRAFMLGSGSMEAAQILTERDRQSMYLQSPHTSMIAAFERERGRTVAIYRAPDQCSACEELTTYVGSDKQHDGKRMLADAAAPSPIKMGSCKLRMSDATARRHLQTLTKELRSGGDYAELNASAMQPLNKLLHRKDLSIDIKVKGVTGAPGSGKTTYAIENLPKNVRVIAPLSRLVTAYREKGYNNAQTHVVGMLKVGDAVALDEVFFMSPGIFTYYALQAKQLYVFGDPYQMGFVDKQSLYGSVTVAGILPWRQLPYLDRSFTVPIDITRHLNRHQYADRPFHTYSKVINSVEYVRALPKGEKFCFTLDYSVRHQQTTVAKTQGMRVDTMSLTAESASAQLLRTVPGQVVVALTRHSEKLRMMLAVPSFQKHLGITPINVRAKHTCGLGDTSYVIKSDGRRKEFAKFAGIRYSEQPFPCTDKTPQQLAKLEARVCDEAPRITAVKDPENHLLDVHLPHYLRATLDNANVPMFDYQQAIDNITTDPYADVEHRGEVVGPVIEDIPSSTHVEEIMQKVAPNTYGIASPHSAVDHFGISAPGRFMSVKDTASHLTALGTLHEEKGKKLNLSIRGKITTADNLSQEAHCYVNRYANDANQDGKIRARARANRAMEGFRRLIDPTKLTMVTPEDVQITMAEHAEAVRQKGDMVNATEYDMAKMELSTLISCFHKVQRKKDLAPNAFIKEGKNDVKAAQGVAAQPKVVNWLVGAFVKAVEKKIRAALLPGIFLGYGTDVMALSRAVERCAGKDLPSLEMDITQFDCVRGLWSDMLMDDVYELCGIDRKAMAYMTELNKKWMFRGKLVTGSVSGHFQSGRADTLTSNTIVNMAIFASHFKWSKIHLALFQGDDSVVRAEGLTQTLRADFLKVVMAPVPTFCSYMVTDHLVVDVVAMCAKLGNRIFRSDNDLRQYQQAVRDWLRTAWTEEQRYEACAVGASKYGIHMHEAEALHSYLRGFADGKIGTSIKDEVLVNATYFALPIYHKQATHLFRDHAGKLLL